MIIYKYYYLIRFDSDDIMNPKLVEKVMNQNKKNDIVRLKMKNFNIMTNRTNIEEAIGQFIMKYCF